MQEGSEEAGGEGRPCWLPPHLQPHPQMLLAGSQSSGYFGEIILWILLFMILRALLP